MIERLQDVFNRVTDRTDIVITKKTKLRNKEYNLSSFTVIQLMCEVEDEFDVEIPNSAIKKFKTVGDIIKFLEQNAG